MKKKALLFSADPGGAACVIPVAKALSEGFAVMAMCKGTATPLFSGYFRHIVEVSGMEFGDIEAMLENNTIDVVITSASSLPEKDMTEKLLWRWAGKRSVPSLAVLDQWENYVRRFSGTEEGDRMGYLPDKIAIMDELARTEMLRDGFPGDRLEVTGHPALEDFSLLAGKKPETGVNRSRRPGGKISVTFFSQPIRSFYGDSLGYDERAAFDDIAGVVRELNGRLERGIGLACKLHPKNTVEDLVYPTARGNDVKFIMDELSNADLILSSDIVIGMNSVMLIHSLLAGVPTIAYEPNRADPARSCMPVRVGAISCVTDRPGLLVLIEKIATDEDFAGSYLKRQELCGSHRGAAKRIAAVVEKLAGNCGMPRQRKVTCR